MSLQHETIASNVLSRLDTPCGVANVAQPEVAQHAQVIVVLEAVGCAERAHGGADDYGGAEMRGEVVSVHHGLKRGPVLLPGEEEGGDPLDEIQVMVQAGLGKGVPTQ